MTNSSFLKRLIFALSVVFFVSCDKDFNDLGSDIVGDDIHSDMIRHEVDVVAYDKPTGAVQSNNLSLNQLGVYDNPVFGKTISHFVNQIEMASQNPTLFTPVIDSVYLYVPYYSFATDAEDDGTTVYDLDPEYIHGDASAKFNLQVYRNGFYLRDTDPGASDNVQRYFSNDKAMVENLKVGMPLAQNAEFAFSPSEIQRKADPDGPDGPKEVKVVERLAPGIFMDLDKAAMQEAIMSAAAKPNLLNNNLFKNYFRGLYFKVEQTGGSVMAVPKFSEGTITIKYTDNEMNTDGSMSEKRSVKTMTFNLKGNTINFFENTYNDVFNNAVATSDALNGDSRLYVKGGEGSMAIININQAGLDELMPAAMGQKVLINEANLVFYVDQNTSTGMGKIEGSRDVIAPLRMYLYDLKNRKPLYDYIADGTSSTSFPKYNKNVFGGIVDTIKEGPAAGRVRYRIRITNHINNIIKGDSLSVPLGLVVTENINVVSNNKLKTPFTAGTTEVKETPFSAVQHPFGTVLYGNAIPEGAPQGDKDQRLKLEIYYTKPK